MSFTEIIYGILFEPVKTLRYLAENKPLGQGLLVFLVVLIFNIIVGQGNSNLSYELSNLSLPVQIGWFISVITGIISFFMLFISAALLSLIGEIIYRKSNAVGLLTCLSFASIPGVLGPALEYLFSLAGIQWLAILISLAVGIWVLVLQVLAVREALLIDTGKAIIVMLIPFVVLIALAVLLVIGVATMSPISY
ncbi:Yip1 family protein [Thermosyntropha sp.]|uniref:Yip1 family protein n=1 Tax=Thermosyntropha sp. TaxID=2740820 RepID=UPI0025E23545|nr:Yip1 family protein [Thermosyntropha sp.]MBO8157949.1 YIP1 family protein [Thermosyntropha sp.]